MLANDVVELELDEDDVVVVVVEPLTAEIDMAASGMRPPVRGMRSFRGHHRMLVELGPLSAPYRFKPLHGGAPESWRGIF
ncbi:hypothetical protein HL658_26780 [Azospirillum sp. RWY-5-1]|uniref:Uncharacterized protein n=1 Tax=Azospirillum oleiclasticum TaxID=2735135 RepID=A0ABX2TFC5_9PROT|nr:hypothetical protein [Azospirillum oleiclasticum]NYZ16162.1 hypothetical protein [Azospirillum oleiclasticum]NYZ23042.1 hypothetical protein [Azospirillum oleiclasticum]